LPRNAPLTGALVDNSVSAAFDGSISLDERGVGVMLSHFEAHLPRRSGRPARLDGIGLALVVGAGVRRTARVEQMIEQPGAWLTHPGEAFWVGRPPLRLELEGVGVTDLADRGAGLAIAYDLRWALPDTAPNGEVVWEVAEASLERAYTPLPAAAVEALLAPRPWERE
jgi:hypothetical protein